jgi:flagellar motor switch protein FliN/FliY
MPPEPQTLPAVEAVPDASQGAAAFPALASALTKSRPLVEGLEPLYDVSVSLSVELGRATLPIRDILRFQAGSVVRLDNAPGDPVEICLNGKLLARGEVVIQDEHFAVRITELIGGER